MTAQYISMYCKCPNMHTAIACNNIVKFVFKNFNSKIRLLLVTLYSILNYTLIDFTILKQNSISLNQIYQVIAIYFYIV